MYETLRALSISFLLFCAGCANPPLSRALVASPTELNYTVAVSSDRETPQIQVSLEFAGSASGQTALVLPSAMYSADKVFAGLKDFKATSTDTLLKDADAPNQKLIAYPPHATVRLSYSIQQISDSLEPFVQSDYFYFNGSLLAHPETGDYAVTIKIDWQLPSNWKLANSFESENRQQTFKGVFNESPVDNIRYSAFVAGDFRLFKIQVHGRLVVFALRGHWKLRDDEFVNAVTKVVQSQREMWRDFDVPYYFVLMLPNGKPCCSRGGHGLTHSFVTYLSDQEYNMEKFTNVLAHEHFHYWNGEKLAPKKGSEFWFTEGFTDYYARVLNYRAGLSTFPDFVDAFNSAIYRYYESPVRDATGERVEKDFFTNSEIAQLPYSKGDLIGSEWNYAIREATKNKASLDDLMRSIYKTARTSELGLTKDLVRSELTALVGIGVANRLMSQALDGKLVVPSPLALGPCADLETVETGRLEYGYDRFSAQPVAAKVKAGSAAYRAGLRDGTEILEKREEWFKPWKMIDLKIRDQAGVRWIHFYPQSDKKLTYPRYRARVAGADCRNF